MSYSVVIVNICILFALIGVGYVAGRTKVVEPAASGDLTALLMKISLPATIFASLARSFDPELLRDGVVCFFVGLVFFLLAMGISFGLVRLLRVPEGKRGTWIMASTFSNTGFVGFPIASAIYGADGLFLASMINLAFNMLVFSVGVRLACMDSAEQGQISLKKILVSNVNIAMAVGLFFFITQIPLPEPVMTLIGYLAALTTPLSMFITGLNLSKGKGSELFRDRDACLASGIRLLAMPVLAFGLLSLLPWREGSLALGVTTVIMAMPAPSICMIMAEQYHGNVDFAGRVIFLSSLAAIVTIPLVLLLV